MDRQISALHLRLLDIRNEMFKYEIIGQAVNDHYNELKAELDQLLTILFAGSNKEVN